MAAIHFQLNCCRWTRSRLQRYWLATSAPARDEIPRFGALAKTEICNFGFSWRWVLKTVLQWHELSNIESSATFEINPHLEAELVLEWNASLRSLKSRMPWWWSTPSLKFDFNMQQLRKCIWTTWRGDTKVADEACMSGCDFVELSAGSTPPPSWGRGSSNQAEPPAALPASPSSSPHSTAPWKTPPCPRPPSCLQPSCRQVWVLSNVASFGALEHQSWLRIVNRKIDKQNALCHCVRSACVSSSCCSS